LGGLIFSKLYPAEGFTDKIRKIISAGLIIPMKSAGLNSKTILEQRPIHQTTEVLNKK
jgi:hypothetical protein